MALSNAHTEELAHFYRSIPFELDEFQQTGCAAIVAGKSVLVAAPTGAGKTIVGEFAVHRALAEGRKAFYTTPIKALSNQKFAELADKYGRDKVGLLTGDNSINSEAPVVVMTTEVLRNMIYANSPTVDELAFVVMDEVHYLADRSRGAVWEEVIIHLAEHVQVVALSATISNAEEFGAWLAQVRGDTEIIVSEHRPVPLTQHMLVGDKVLEMFGKKRTVSGGRGGKKSPGAAVAINEHLVQELKGPRPSATGSSRGGDRRGRRGSYRQRHRGSDTRRDQPRATSHPKMVQALDQEGLLPGICFIFSRMGCEKAVQQCRNANLRLTTTDEATRIRSIVAARCADLPDSDLRVLDFEAWLNGLARGIAAHHAGMLPTFKSIVEDLFEEGLIKMVFATETLALGINMPARSVVIDKLSKYNGDTHVELTPGEYTQLTGRAGRRGLDTVGHAVVMHRPGLNLEFVAGLASARTYPLKSSFRPSYNMAVNLVHRLGVQQARTVLESSYAQFQADRAAVGLASRIAQEQEALAGYAEAMHCHLGDYAEYARYVRDLHRVEKLERNATGTRRRDLQRESSALKQKVNNHPVHGCKDRQAHARWEQRHHDLERTINKRLRQLTRRTGSIVVLFDQVCRVLVDTGYLTGAAEELTVTQAGASLMRLYVETDLLMAECLRQDVWVHLDAPGLCAIISCLVFNGRGDDVPTEPHVSSTKLRLAWTEMTAIMQDIHTVERDRSMPLLRSPDPRAIAPMLLWASGATLEQVLVGEDITPGDFVRLCRQTIDALGQLRAASVDPAFRKRINQGLAAIDRGVVSYSAGAGGE